MQTPNQPVRELPFFTKISNLKLSPPLATALVVTFIALGFSVYLAYVSYAIKPSGSGLVPLVMVNQPLDSIRVVSSGERRMDMILVGTGETETIFLQKDVSYLYEIKSSKTDAGAKVMVKDSVKLYSSKLDTLLINKTRNHFTPDTDNMYIDRSRLVYVEYPYMLMWTILISLLNAVSWVAGFILLYKIIQYLKQIEVSARRRTWVVLLAVLAVIVYFISAMKFAPIDYGEICSKFGIVFKKEQVYKLFNIVTRPVEICGVMAAGTLLLLPFISYQAINNPDFTEPQKKIDAQKEIRDDFVLLVTFMTGLILVGMITNVLMYQILQFVLGTDFKYLVPREFTFAYGLKYSIVLAIFYFPVYYSLQQTRENLRQTLLNTGVPSTDVDSQLGSFGTSAKFWDRFKIITAALTPLLGSLGMELIKLITDLY